MIKYHKIDTLFKRDTGGTKKLIEGSFRDETMAYLYSCGAQFVFTEKIDGTNISIEWDGHDILFHGRTERAQLPSHLLEELERLFLNNETEELFEQFFGEKPMIFYGEGYGPKIQSGGAYRDTVSFILFDIYSPSSDTWMQRDAVEEIAKAFGLDVVPILLIGTLDEAVRFVKEREESTFGTAKLEGVVGRPLVELKDRKGKRVIVKIKREDFDLNGSGTSFL